MGFEALSMNAANLLRVKAAIRQVALSSARQLLQEVLGMDSGEVIAAHVDLHLKRAGLADLLQYRRSV